MKHIIIFILSICLLYGLQADGKHKYRGLPRTEVGLMNNLLGCLKYKDSVNYYYLFPPFDTLWRFVMHNPDHSPETVKALNQLKEHPESLIEFDPHFNGRIMGRYLEVLKKGEDSGIHWENIVMQRYELRKETMTRPLAGYEKIAPERFKGYIFVRDMLGRLTFCISVTEIQKINGFFFGGQVLNVLEAADIEQFLLKEQQERNYFDWHAAHPEYDSLMRDSLRNDSIKNGLLDTVVFRKDASNKKKQSLLSMNPQEDEKSQVRKEVINRKYYEGKFDEDIPVKLYVRYLRTPKGKTESYDGLYKFGDQEDYVKLTITKNPEGKWVMDDETPLGSMELELINKVYKGSWTNTENQTGYDAVLTQADISQKKIEQLDNILEKGLTGRVDDEATEESKEKKKAKDAEKDSENVSEEKFKVSKAFRKDLRKQRRREREQRSDSND